MQGGRVGSEDDVEDGEEAPQDDGEPPASRAEEDVLLAARVAGGPGSYYEYVERE